MVTSAVDYSRRTLRSTAWARRGNTEWTKQPHCARQPVFTTAHRASVWLQRTLAARARRRDTISRSPVPLLHDVSFDANCSMLTYRDARGRMTYDHPAQTSALAAVVATVVAIFASSITAWLVATLAHALRDAGAWGTFAVFQGSEDPYDQLASRGLIDHRTPLPMQLARMRIEGGAPYCLDESSGTPTYPPDAFDTPCTYPLAGYVSVECSRSHFGEMLWVPKSAADCPALE